MQSLLSKEDTVPVYVAPFFLINIKIPRTHGPANLAYFTRSRKMRVPVPENKLDDIQGKLPNGAFWLIHHMHACVYASSNTQAPL